jgi:DNA-binding CsgD family transcriptional regulator
VTRPPDLDPRELEALRGAAAALARQDGAGVPRRVLVALAPVGRHHEVTVHAGDPPLAVVRPQPGGALGAALTAREREVAALIADGRTNAAIADALVISPTTVKDHVHHILEKTGLPNRAAVAAAWRAGA